MIKSLHLRDFKSFRDASIAFGPLTLIVGTNASGKSNLRDALRFLVGVGRGYAIGEILEGRWGEGSVHEWLGIRGGAPEVARRSSRCFSIECCFETSEQLAVNNEHSHGLQRVDADWTFRIALQQFEHAKIFRVQDESLRIGDDQIVYESEPATSVMEPGIRVSIHELESADASHQVQVHRKWPVLNQLIKAPISPDFVTFDLIAASRALRDIQFLDLVPDAMREPSPPDLEVLGDRGENLSSVLQSICQDGSKRAAILEWLRYLTPLDVTDLDFAVDHRGYLLAVLVEQDGTRTTAFSASDGTLRFLGMIAALFGPRPARLYFIEELDTGIHPTRLTLLLDLIESRVKESGIQIVATTHAPHLLGLLSDGAREHAVLTYRLESSNESQIIRIMDIPHVREVLENRNLSRLHESGWLENVMELSAEPSA